MTFAEALIWLVQNPESVAIRGGQRIYALNQAGALMTLKSGKPDYARVNTRDIVAADWQCMAMDAFIQQAEQARQEG